MTICPTKDQIARQVCALFPRGRAWEAADEPGTTLNNFIKGLSGGLQFVEQRVCDMVNELFCSTASETRDIWNADYGLPDDCDPLANTLCGKVAAKGGSRCEYFVESAENMGWSITCEDVSDLPIAITGCWSLGCAPLGPPAEIDFGDDCLEVGVCDCSYDRAVDHPEPEFWQSGSEKPSNMCPVPGSSLGCAPLGPDQCCNFAGFYEVYQSETVNAVISSACGYPFTAVNIEPYCNSDPINNGQFPQCPAEPPYKFKPYIGHRYHWKVKVNVPSSMALQGIEEPKTSYIGCAQLGCDGLLLGSPVAITEVPCFLERIKPAHTVILLEYEWE